MRLGSWARPGLAGLLVVAGCASQNPAGPGVAGANEPVVTAIHVSNTHAELTDQIVVTADVSDAETPVDELEYVWSATAGFFTGAGRTVTWSIPKGSYTPLDVTFALRVSRPLRGHHAATFLAPNLVHVQNSTREIGDIVFAFLVTYFGNSNVGADAAVVDFIDPCPECPVGKTEERSDVQFNREHYTFISSQIRILDIDLNAARTYAEIEAYCAFESREKSSGVSGTAYGICTLTAVYDQGRWWLCESHARPLSGSGAGTGVTHAEHVWAERFFRRSTPFR